MTTSTHGIPFDAEQMIEKLAEGTAEGVRGLGRRGAVVAVSGGVDSGVAAGLCGPRPRPRARAAACACPSATSASVPSTSASSSPRRSAREPSRSRSPPRSRGSVATDRRDEAIRQVFPDYEPDWQHKLVRSRADAAGSSSSRSSSSGPTAPRSSGGCRPDAYQRADRRDEHEAARPQAPRVHLGRPARLRGDRHAEPARVRPGVLRQGRRRARRREADRGLYKSQVYALARELGLARGDRHARRRRPRRSASPQTPGGVLLRPPVRAHGPAACGGTHKASSRPISPRGSGSSRSEVEAAYREIERRRVATEYLHAPAIIVEPGRLSDVCGIAGIVRPQARAAGRRGRRSSGWRGRSAIAGPTASGIALDAGAGWSRPGSRSSTCPCGWQPIEAGAGGSDPRLQRRGLQPLSSFARARARGRDVRDHERHRGRAAAARARGPRARSTASTASSRSPGGSPARRRLTLVRDRFGVRPLYYALLDDGTLVFGSEAKALFASGEVRRGARSRGHRRGLHALGRRAPPRTAFAGVQQLPPGRPASSGSAARIVERAHVVEARLRSATTRRTRSSGRAAARQRPAAPAGRRAGRGLPLRGPRLEPDHALWPSERPSISCAPSRSPSRTRATTSAAIRRQVARALGTHHHVVEIGPGEIAGRVPGRRSGTSRRPSSAPRRCRCSCSPARSARSDITVVVTGEGADELFWGYDLFKEVVVRELYERDPERRARSCSSELYPYLGAAGARRGPAWRPLPARDGRRRRPARLAPDPRRRRPPAVKAFYRPRGRRRDRATTPRSSAFASELPAELRPLERARAGSLARGRRRCSSRTCWPRRATASRWRTGSRGGSRSSTTASSSTRRDCPPSDKLAGMRDKIALRELAADLLPAEIVDRAEAALPRARGRAVLRPRMRRTGSRRALSPAALDETGIWDAERVAGLAAALPSRPRDRDARGDGAGRDPLDPALASGVLWQRT